MLNELLAGRRNLSEPLCRFHFEDVMGGDGRSVCEGLLEAGLDQDICVMATGLQV